MKPFSRSDRVAGHIKKNLAEILMKDIKDPRVKAASITGVKLAADLKSAKIYYIVSGSKKAKSDVEEGFDKARGFIKRKLAKNLGLRYMPDIKFFYDDSFDYGSHIDNILSSLKEKENWKEAE